MIKYLLLALLIAWLFFASPWGRARVDKTAGRRPASPPSTPTPTPMVECAHCGLHLPAHEALIGFGATGSPDPFCCEAHRKAGARAH